MSRSLVFSLLLILCVAAVVPAQESPYRLIPGWPSLPSGWNLGEVPGIAQDSRGHIYVFNRSPHPLLEFDPSGRFVREIGEGMFVSAHSVRIDSEDNIWAVDVNAHFVVRFNPQGRVTMVLGYKNRGSEEPEYFNRPTDIAFARNGDFYITDGYVNSRVVKYSKDGKLLKIWGKKGTGPGEFNLPHAVVVDAKGRVYVADRENKRIQIFDSDGNFIREWKQFGSPWGLEITPDQHIFMADGYADRVVELDTEGKQLGTLGSSGKAPGQFFYAHGICAGKDGALYVSEIRNWRVQKFVRR